MDAERDTDGTTDAHEGDHTPADGAGTEGEGGGGGGRRGGGGADEEGGPDGEGGPDEAGGRADDGGTRGGRGGGDRAAAERATGAGAAIYGPWNAGPKRRSFFILSSKKSIL